MMRRSSMTFARTTRRFASASANTAPPAATIAAGESGVRACALAILEQHKTLLCVIDDATYTFPSPLLQASVGQHTRHSLDHLHKPIETLLETATANDEASAGDDEVVIRYDLRQRNTVIEHDRAAAIDQIERLQKSITALDDSVLRQRLRAAFMLSADGQEFAFESTLSREMAFAVHHCIHHNALSKVLLRHHFPDLELPSEFGMAPSTSNFNSSNNSSANSSASSATKRCPEQGDTRDHAVLSYRSSLCSYFESEEAKRRMRGAMNDSAQLQPPLPPSPPLPPPLPAATAAAAIAHPATPAPAAANAFANDGNFMAQFLASQQQQQKSSSSTGSSSDNSNKPVSARVEDAVVTAAERDDHVKESVLKNDGSFMATFLALQHKEERLAKQKRNDARMLKLLSASSAASQANANEPKGSKESSREQDAAGNAAKKRALVTPSASMSPSVSKTEKVASEQPKKKRSRWDSALPADTASTGTSSSSKPRSGHDDVADDTDEAKAVALLVEGDDANDALIRAKQQKHVAELRFLEQRIRGFQQQMQLGHASKSSSKAQANEMLTEERRAEYERLAALLEEEKAYKDSIEDAELGKIQDGTLEHRRRAREMLETLQSAESLTKRGEGKHHLGDFLPQAELDKFMREAKTLARSDEVDASLLQSQHQATGAIASNGTSSHSVAAASAAGAAGRGLGFEPASSSSGQLQQDDDEFDQYRKRMMLAYRFRPNPLNNPRRPYS